MTYNERIEKDFWKHCKDILESEGKVLPDFDETICYEHFIKLLKKSEDSGDYSPPWRMKILDEPTSLLDLSPPTYREISNIFHKMRSSGSTCSFDHVSVIALKRCPILSPLSIALSYNVGKITSFQRPGKMTFVVLIYYKG